jgi:hypothetical protein
MFTIIMTHVLAFAAGLVVARAYRDSESITEFTDGVLALCQGLRALWEKATNKKEAKEPGTPSLDTAKIDEALEKRRRTRTGRTEEGPSEPANMEAKG